MDEIEIKKRDTLALAVECPICEAPKGERCVSAWRRDGPVAHQHDTRIHRAEKAQP